MESINWTELDVLHNLMCKLARKITIFLLLRPSHSVCRFAIGFRVYASVRLNIVVLYQRVLCTLNTRTMMKPR